MCSYLKGSFSSPKQVFMLQYLTASKQAFQQFSPSLGDKTEAVFTLIVCLPYLSNLRKNSELYKYVIIHMGRKAVYLFYLLVF